MENESGTQRLMLTATIYNTRSGKTETIDMSLDIELDRMAKFFAYRLAKNKNGKSVFMNGVLKARRC